VVEHIVAGGYRGVGGEDVTGRDQFECRVEVQAGGDLFTDALQNEKGCMALVHMEHRGLLA